MEQDKAKALRDAIKEFIRRQSRFHIQIDSGPYEILQQALKDTEDGNS